MLGDIWKKPIDENPITKPVAIQLEFYENALDTLNKKIAFYLMKKVEVAAQVKDLSKAFRRVAATERSSSLQENFFLVADRYDAILEQLESYSRCREQTTAMVEDARIYMVKPLREVIVDVSLASSNIAKYKKKNPNAPALAPGLDQHLSDATNMMNVSTYLYEKHRVASLRTILINLVHTELLQHAAAIEQLSPVLEQLHRLDVEDDYEGGAFDGDYQQNFASIDE